ncbi:uncharacterized protein PV09_00437 [Verruconis gallopava]|uniref:Uncharacterized protein n=1 Tax=Verruconis gallopava TaxID=253628 RepID=A0A0D2BDV1_9PEZI|nr:uncharacterized protein PV09_00437 [Verruconis gallopava]KIW09564.1 hypothetical protein PV09_00437 [Verruconis gallopava]
MSRYSDRDSRPPPPRERSPARSYRPGGSSYSTFSSRPRDFGGPYNDAPRGPRGVSDASRPPLSNAPRGRSGFGSRFEPRDSRDVGFSNDRLYEGGDRYDPRRRSPTRDRRDSRDVPRQLDTDRAARQERGDGPPSAGSNASDAAFRPSGSSFRSGYARGRSSDFRDRGRPRSRSRERRERDRSNDSRDLGYRDRERANDARYGRDRADDRDTYPRRSDLPSRIEPRDLKGQGESRGQTSQSAPQTDRPQGPHQAPPDRPVGEFRRDQDLSRRGSAVSDNSRDARRENDRPDSSAGRSDSQRANRPASPPPAVPAVPAFGFRTPAPFSSVTSLSWKNPELQKPPPASGPAQPSKPAPTAPKALSVAPPTAPKADRVLEKTPSRESLANAVEESKERATSAGASPSPRLASAAAPDGTQQAKFSPAAATSFLNPPSAPRAMTSPQPSFGRAGVVGGFGRATSPVATAAIPTGPKASAPVNASPRMIPGAIPTGPRAERGAPPSAPRNAPPAPKLFKSSSQLFPRASVVPSKRDINGLERERGTTNEHRLGEIPPQGTPSAQSVGNGDVPVPVEVDKSVVKQETATATAPQESAPQEDVDMADVPAEESKRSPTVEEQSHSFPISEDEEDEAVLTDMAEFLEDKFFAEKKRIEAKRVDLSTNELRPTLLFPELSRLVAMRAMVNDLSYRSRTGAEKKETATKTKEVPCEVEQALPQPPPEEVVLPQDEDGDQLMSDGCSSTESSLDRMSTPDPESLPYLEKGFSTPLSDADPFSVTNREIPEEAIKNILKKDVDAEALDQLRMEQEFRELYMEWRKSVNRLDRERDEAERAAKQCSPESNPPLSTSDVAGPSLTTSSEGGRRAHRFASEYELQRVMEISLREEEEKKQKDLALKEAQVSATADREAEIPDLLPPSVAKRRIFKDVSQARRPQDALRIFDFVPPVDDFSEEEDRIMREVYKEYTKQWGKIAKAVGRTYKECINHYYASKWDRRYKSRVGGKRGRGARGGRKPAGRQARSALVPAEDAAETDANGTPMMTESGRPRRAAAPTWPKDSDQDQNGANSATGKRGAKGDGKDGEAVTEKASRRKAKEKAPKKTARNQPLAARPTTSPQKVDRDIKDKQIQTPELENAWQFKETGATGQTEHIPPLMPQPHVYPEANLTGYREVGDVGSVAPPAERPRSHSNATQRQGPSSYWSVTDEQEFIHWLKHYGTDFQAISSHMGTKTSTMLKNRYQKFVNDGKHGELIRIVNEVTQRRSRGEDMGPPPMPPQAPNRHGRYEVPSATLPRNLAPSNEVAESDQSTSVPVTVSYGMSPPFGPRPNIPQQVQRNTPAQATNASGHRPRQVGPILGFFGDDVRTSQPQSNTIRPLIAPPEEPQGQRAPERIKTEFRPVEHDRELLGRQERERERERERIEREYEDIRRRQVEIGARNAQIAAERREQERVYQHPGPSGHTSQTSIHSIPVAPEHGRHDSRQHVFPPQMPAAAVHTTRNVIVDLTGPQAAPMAGQSERRPQSPPRHHALPPLAQQPQAPPPAAPSPTPPSAASKEAPRRSNLMSLLNVEPEPEKPKAQARVAEPVIPAVAPYRISATMQSETAQTAATARDAMADRPYSRPTYPPTGLSASSLSTPTNESGGRESLPPMAHRDSWSSRQASHFPQTNSPGLHAQHVAHSQERAPLFSNRDYRSTAFGALNGPNRAQPSPPPASTPFGQHSRTPSYSHPAHQTPTSSVPVAPAVPPPALHAGHYGQREPLAPGHSPHLGPQHHPPSNTRPEFGIHQRLQEQPREALFDRLRERERDREHFDYAAARERDQREREQALREREYQEQMAHQQRYGHHTPPVNQSRYPPPQAVPERSTATPLSHVGYPPPQDHHAQAVQRQYDYNQELQRRDFERERSRQNRIQQAAADAEVLQRRARMEAEVRRVHEQQQYRRPEEQRYPGMPPR